MQQKLSIGYEQLNQIKLSIALKIIMGNKFEPLCCQETRVQTAFQHSIEVYPKTEEVQVSRKTEEVQVITKEEVITKEVVRQQVICDICAQAIEEKFVLPCKHIYHKACISEYLKARITAKSLKMPCPSACGQDMPYQVLKQVVGVDEFRVYEKSLLQNLVETRKENLYCPTPNCVGIYQIVEYAEQFFYCEFCLKGYCLICRKEEHEGQDCNFKEEQASIAAMVECGMKPCPYCQRMVEKNGGCCSVMCRCGKQFCFTCGGTKCPHGSCLTSPQVQPVRRERARSTIYIPLQDDYVYQE